MEDGAAKKREFIYAGLVQLGKFSAVVADSSVYKNGFNLPAGMNAGNVLGLVTEGIVPEVLGAYRNGSWEGISQTAWPLNMDRATPQGVRRYVVYRGPFRARAAGAWNRGDRLIVANSTGQLAFVVTLGLPAGTAINVVAVAEEPTLNPGDVAAVILNLYRCTV
jgi:hypothetical protein